MTQHLMDKPQAGKYPAPPSSFSGAILGLQGDVLHGWAVDTVQPALRPVVEVYIDGVSVTIVRADQFEPLAPIGDQFHGFTVQLRQSWLDEARVITAQIANQAFTLEGQILLPTPPTQSITSISSQVWHTGGLHVGGWCWDPQTPHRHVQVSVREGDKVIAQATCNIHHQALAYRTTSDHGFSLDLPWELADGKLHVLEIVNDLGQPLSGNPIRLCCWPQGVEGLLKRLDPTHDPATLSLLAEVAKEQTLRLPKSAGWESYPQWFEAFQRLEEIDTPKMQGKLGLLLISEGDHELEHVSLTSLGACQTGLYQMATAPSSDLSAAVYHLLEAGCDRILPMHAGDRLAPLALPHLNALLDDGSAWAYADCDRDGPLGERSLPWFKPVWDINLFIGADIFMSGAIFGATIVKRALDLLASRINGAKVNWHDLTAGIALATQVADVSVAHLPRVLYHRANHLPASPEQANPELLRQHAIEWMCQYLAKGATVSSMGNYPALLRAHWPLPEHLPKISLIVPTRDQYELLHACVEGLLNKTDYPNLEIIIVDNQSSDPDTLTYLIELKARGLTVLPHPYPFNYSAINNRAIEFATGELIGLINNDIQIIEPNWLKEMVSQLLRKNVGAVGAKLLWPNRMVQHGGVVIGINGLAAHAGNNLNEDDCGYLGTNQISRRQSAVTAACLIMRKNLYLALNGLDEIKFPVAFNDVDLCLRINQLNLDLIWTADAKLIHAESASRGKDISSEKKSRAEREQRLFFERWCTAYEGDECYHPALSQDYLSGPYGGLAMPPLPAKARTRLTIEHVAL
ncbi:MULTISPECIES: glycosyltransferase [unclassified Pseudomonas]|uniref:glycosyltransferase family 2 protein n=1 Tax=unclassified Pseudomonas TaxID=196821 RepID=UPI002579CE21|nr:MULTISPECIES: glycosyltransferase [unclassified Pseudomonas]